MRKRVLFMLLAAGALSLPAVEQRISRTFPMERSGSLLVVNGCGPIQVSTHSRPEVQVEGLIEGDSQQALAAAQLEFSRNGEQLMVRVKPPEGGASVRVELRIKVPEGLTRSQLESQNGGLEVEGTYGAIEAKSINGSISFRGLPGEAQFQSVNGRLDLAILAELRGNIRARAINGRIVLSLHPRSSFQVEALAWNGRASSDFPLQERRDATSGRLHGAIQGGRFSLTLESSNDNIRLTRS